MAEASATINELRTLFRFILGEGTGDTSSPIPATEELLARFGEALETLRKPLPTQTTTTVTPIVPPYPVVNPPPTIGA